MEETSRNMDPSARARQPTPASTPPPHSSEPTDVQAFDLLALLNGMRGQMDQANAELCAQYLKHAATQTAHLKTIQHLHGMLPRVLAS